MDDVRNRLREAADAHEPDRARMLARVERGLAGHPADQSARRRPRRTGPLPWPRVVLATLATAGVMALGGLAAASLVRTPSPAPAAPASSTTPTPVPTDSPAPASPSPSRTPERTDTATATSPSAAATASRPSSAPPAGRHPEDGPLWSDGSVDPHSTSYWAQSNVTLKTTQPLTALTVELRIALTAGVQDTGHWQTQPADAFDVTVRQEGGFLVYRWTLKPGGTVPVGQHVFAGQYNHAAGGRDAKDDTYGADTDTSSVWGDFARTTR
ncbi:hypothetical protein GCM10010441_13960 [Kitasatospora paracochleata]|uniref:Uncharacterized protein n=1 Tax=Kitasatospora paracochleata TaxID=58354 RepID=A0ABT1JAM9_9ACTN|nr:hypothetical protein [Kitasatospora paracochleata]MCP2314507.1 hypothetical protein [Kitasatospora paracochleata]